MHACRQSWIKQHYIVSFFQQDCSTYLWSVIFLVPSGVRRYQRSHFYERLPINTLPPLAKIAHVTAHVPTSWSWRHQYVRDRLSYWRNVIDECSLAAAARRAHQARDKITSGPCLWGLGGVALCWLQWWHWRRRGLGLLYCPEMDYNFEFRLTRRNGSVYI